MGFEIRRLASRAPLIVSNDSRANLEQQTTLSVCCKRWAYRKRALTACTHDNDDCAAALAAADGSLRRGHGYCLVQRMCHEAKRRRSATARKPRNSAEIAYSICVRQNCRNPSAHLTKLSGASHVLNAFPRAITTGISGLACDRMKRSARSHPLRRPTKLSDQARVGARFIAFPAS